MATKPAKSKSKLCSVAVQHSTKNNLCSVAVQHSTQRNLGSVASHLEGCCSCKSIRALDVDQAMQRCSVALGEEQAVQRSRRRVKRFGEQW